MIDPARATYPDRLLRCFGIRPPSLQRPNTPLPTPLQLGPPSPATSDEQELVPTIRHSQQTP